MWKFAAFLCVFLGAGQAFAQYKNSAFGLDLGPVLISKPSVVDANGNILPVDQRPLRLANGFRIGGESDFKMDEDHVWFVGRVNGHFLRFSQSSNDSATERD